MVSIREIFDNLKPNKSVSNGFAQQTYVVTATTPEELLTEKIQIAAKQVDYISIVVRVIVTAIVTYLLVGVIFGIAIVDGRSMYPNLKDGNILLINRLDKNPDHGDVILLKATTKEDYVKRVIGVTGDQIDITAEGQLIVNGEIQQEEEIFSATTVRSGGLTFPVTVPDGNVFVLGDNREVSKDSRTIGMISKKSIIGTVIYYSGKI